MESLHFELVDYAVDYIGWKNKVSSYKPGLSENYRLERILKNLVDRER